ncbi:MAG: methionyl-tRNA formyltransferase [Thermoguttaceae bacterium]|nr:methionyl-tRNA formyltransferase [Thermoguttaceae bacterium]
MNILVMGTGGFVIPSLEALVASKHHVVALVTMPVRSLRKDAKGGIPPVRAVAERLGIPLLEPENVNDSAGLALLKQLDYDLIFICDYGKILSREVIASARLGGVNLHGSLLPQYRGAAPINRAILDGRKEIGISVIHIVPEVDAGPVVATDSYYPTQRETAVEIENELARRGAPLLLKVLDDIEQGRTTPLLQDASLVSKAPKLKKEEGFIDWAQTCDEIINRYRAMQPWPKTFSVWLRPNQTPLRLILGPFEKVPLASPFESAPAGAIVLAKDDVILIRTGDGVLRVLDVQPAGKKLMTAEAFLRGYRMKTGDQFEKSIHVQ